MSYKGLVIKPLSPTDYKFGSLGDAPVNPGGHWGNWLPPAEDQDINGIEPCDCTSNGTLNCVEILGRFLYQNQTQWSKRYLAKISHTACPGNDPGTVAQALRTQGTVTESLWPTDSSITTLDQFYAAPPAFLATLALEFIDQYNFQYEFVTDLSQASLMQALEYSPLGVGVYAWDLDPTTQLYVNPKNLPAEHFVCLYDYVPNYYFLVFDSYDQNVKRLAWDFPFALAMRYSLTNQIVQPSWFATFIQQIKAILGI